MTDGRGGGVPDVLGFLGALAHIFREIISVLALSRLWGSLWTVSKIQLRTFSDTLLMESMIAIFRWFCSPEGVINSSCGNYGFFLAWV